MATLFLAAHMGLSFASNQKDEVLKDLDLKKSDIADITKSRVIISYPENKTTRLYATLKNSPADHLTILDFYDAYKNHPYYPLYAITEPSPFFGSGGWGDKLTLGLSKKVVPCQITFPSNRLDMWELFNGFTDLKPYWLKNRPGTIEDYKKLILFHELEHCNQKKGDAASQELKAEKKAFDRYLSTGGHLDVVRSNIYFTAMASIRQMINYDDVKDSGAYLTGVRPEGEYIYVMAPILHHQYFNGPAMTLEQCRKAYKNALIALKDYAAKHKKDVSLTGLGLQKDIDGILKDHHSQVDPHTRHVLELYQEAYHFFTTPPKKQGKPLETQKNCNSNICPLPHQP